MTSQYTPPFGADPFEDTGVFDDAYDLAQQAQRHAQEDADLKPTQGGPRPVKLIPETGYGKCVCGRRMPHPVARCEGGKEQYLKGSQP